VERHHVHTQMSRLSRPARRQPPTRTGSQGSTGPGRYASAEAGGSPQGGSGGLPVAPGRRPWPDDRRAVVGVPEGHRRQRSRLGPELREAGLRGDSRPSQSPLAQRTNGVAGQPTHRNREAPASVIRECRHPAQAPAAFGLERLVYWHCGARGGQIPVGPGRRALPPVQRTATPTMGLAGGLAPRRPRNGADVKSKIPPSLATIR